MEFSSSAFFGVPSNIIPIKRRKNSVNTIVNKDTARGFTAESSLPAALPVPVLP